VIQRPENTVGELYNYKRTKNIILMAIVDTNYCCNARVVLLVIKPPRQVVTLWLRVAWGFVTLKHWENVEIAATSYVYNSAPISGVILNVIIKPITTE
jgi:hypothetical protein